MLMCILQKQFNQRIFYKRYCNILFNAILAEKCAVRAAKLFFLRGEEQCHSLLIFRSKMSHLCWMQLSVRLVWSGASIWLCFLLKDYNLCSVFKLRVNRVFRA